MPTIQEPRELIDADPMGYLIGTFAQLIALEIETTEPAPRQVTVDDAHEFDAIPLRIHRPGWTATLAKIIKDGPAAETTAVYEITYRSPPGPRRAS